MPQIETLQNLLRANPNNQAVQKAYLAAVSSPSMNGSISNILGGGSNQSARPTRFYSNAELESMQTQQQPQQQAQPQQTQQTQQNDDYNSSMLNNIPIIGGLLNLAGRFGNASASGIGSLIADVPGAIRALSGTKDVQFANPITNALQAAADPNKGQYLGDSLQQTTGSQLDPTLKGILNFGSQIAFDPSMYMGGLGIAGKLGEGANAIGRGVTGLDALGILKGAGGKLNDLLKGGEKASPILNDVGQDTTKIIQQSPSQALDAIPQASPTVSPSIPQPSNQNDLMTALSNMANHSGPDEFNNVVRSSNPYMPNKILGATPDLGLNPSNLNGGQSLQQIRDLIENGGIPKTTQNLLKETSTSTKVSPTTQVSNTFDNTPLEVGGYNDVQGIRKLTGGDWLDESSGFGDIRTQSELLKTGTKDLGYDVNPQSLINTAKPNLSTISNLKNGVFTELSNNPKNFIKDDVIFDTIKSTTGTDKTALQKFVDDELGGSLPENFDLSSTSAKYSPLEMDNLQRKAMTMSQDQSIPLTTRNAFRNLSDNVKSAINKIGSAGKEGILTRAEISGSELPDLVKKYLLKNNSVQGINNVQRTLMFLDEGANKGLRTITNGSSDAMGIIKQVVPGSNMIGNKFRGIGVSGSGIKDKLQNAAGGIKDFAKNTYDKSVLGKTANSKIANMLKGKSGGISDMLNNSGIPMVAAQSQTNQNSSGDSVNTSIDQVLSDNKNKHNTIIQKAILSGMDSSSAKALADSQAPLLSDTQRKSVEAIKNSFSSIDQLQQAYGEVNSMKGPITGDISNLLGGVGIDQDAKVYNQITMGLLSTLKAAAGESGVLSDQDVERIKGWVPSLSDTTQSAEKKIGKIRQLLTNKASNTLQLIGQ